MRNLPNQFYRFFFLPALLLGIVLLPGSGAFGQKSSPKLGAYIKTSLNAYSFNSLLNQGKNNSGNGIDLFDLLDFAARNNFDAVDLTGYYFPGYPSVPSDEYINSIKKRAFELGLDISGTGVKNDFANPDAAKRAADVELVKKWIDVAAKLGAPVIRVFAGEAPKEYENRREEVAAYMALSLKECVAYGKEKGVLVGVQNHGDFLKTAEQCIDMVKRVDSDWFGLIVDTGKFITDDPYVDIEKAIPFAVNFQVKESPFGPRGSVKTDLNRLIQIVQRTGYRGYLPIETLEIKGQPRPVPDIPYEPYKVVPLFLQRLKEAIKQEFKS